MNDYQKWEWDPIPIPIPQKTEFGRVPRMGYADPNKRKKARALRRAKQKSR